MEEYFSLKWVNNRLVMLDQRQLPGTVEYIEYAKVEDVAQAIRVMVVRGAPAIGAAAGYGMALAALGSKIQSIVELRSELMAAGDLLIEARPTAVNLPWAVKRCTARFMDTGQTSADEIKIAVLDEAHAIYNEDISANQQMGQHGMAVLPPNARVIHHCNTGALATSGYGTALGVIRAAHEGGKGIFVYVDETRPRLQGARLTCWELGQLGIPYQLIVDGAAAHVMRTLGVDACLVGCDRVAANGDTANKIGTFQLALAARAMGVKFYVVGPTSTIDQAIPDGGHIPVEERSEDEITQIEGKRIAAAGAKVFNPAFDVTPAEYISAIITEKGIAYPPYEKSIRSLFGE